MVNVALILVNLDWDSWGFCCCLNWDFWDWGDFWDFVVGLFGDCDGCGPTFVLRTFPPRVGETRPRGRRGHPLLAFGIAPPYVFRRGGRV